MTADDIVAIVKAASDLGIGRLKLTGGEPLLRSDVVDIVRRVSPLVEEVSMTTNGVLLASKAYELSQAGLARVNVSLDSIEPATYKRICGSYHLEEVMAGIDGAIEAGLTPLKINMVLLAGYNEKDVPRMLEFVAQKGIVLQLIEYVVSKDDEGDGRFQDHHIELGPFEDQLTRTAELVGMNQLHNRRRFRMTTVPGTLHWPETRLSGPAELELVTPWRNHEFCANCRRIRVTSSGRIKGCLFQEKGTVDALGLMRNGASGPELKEAIKKVVSARRPYYELPDGASCRTEILEDQKEVL
jgi:cyclic pyranopterin phosphate synthase